MSKVAPVLAECPYYRASSSVSGSSSITCEGFLPGTISQKTRFESRILMLSHRTAYCQKDYWNCPICELVDRKYEEEDE